MNFEDFNIKCSKILSSSCIRRLILPILPSFPNWHQLARERRTLTAREPSLLVEAVMDLSPDIAMDRAMKEELGQILL
jgi:hypothetical protein